MPPPTRPRSLASASVSTFQPPLTAPTMLGQGNAHVVIEDVGEAAVVHRGRRADRDARRIHRDDEHADAGMRGFASAVGARREEHVLAPPGRGPDLLAVDDPLVAVGRTALVRSAARSEPASGSL